MMAPMVKKKKKYWCFDKVISMFGKLTPDRFTHVRALGTLPTLYVKNSKKLPHLTLCVEHVNNYGSPAGTCCCQ